jgi:hypothetical protein
MKQLLIAVILLKLAAIEMVQGAEAQETLAWCGLDYSKVKMIGTQDFRQPENIFPGIRRSKNYRGRISRSGPGSDSILTWTKESL